MITICTEKCENLAFAILRLQFTISHLHVQVNISDQMLKHSFQSNTLRSKGEDESDDNSSGSSEEEQVEFNRRRQKVTEDQEEFNRKKIKLKGEKADSSSSEEEQEEFKRRQKIKLKEERVKAELEAENPEFAANNNSLLDA